MHRSFFPLVSPWVSRPPPARAFCRVNFPFSLLLCTRFFCCAAGLLTFSRLHAPTPYLQAEKMGMGNLRYTVTFYPGSCLVHVNLAPLVVTLVHKDAQGDSDNFNYGDALDLIPELTIALEPLREHVR